MSVGEFGSDLLRRLLERLVDSVDGAVGAGVGVVTGTDRPDTAGGPDGAQVRRGRAVAGVGVAPELDRSCWDAGSGPLFDAASGVPVRVPDAGPAAPGGLVAMAGEWNGEGPLVLSVYFDRPPQDDAVERIDRWEGVVGSALAVVEYCSGEQLRAEQMVRMTQYRRVIEQAKGLLMGALGVDAAAAFTALSRASQHFDIRLRTLAVALVEHVGGAPAEAPDDPGAVIVPTPQDRRVAAQVWAALAPSGAGGGTAAW